MLRAAGFPANVNGMKLAGWTTQIFGVLLVAAGWLGWLAEGAVSPTLGTVLGVLFCLLGYAYLRGSMPAGYLSAAGMLLTAIYFAYRFLVTESLFPAGLLLVFSFATLFLVLLGFFISLARVSHGGS